ncbi:unnamed protein product [Oreochromis niloticus]|nr:unnamed protein product [Mustela putorius furo]
MFRPISAPACEVPSPPPADAWLQSKDTDKVMHPDFKNDRSSLDDEVAFFMCPSDVPLPPRPPPIAELRLCRKRTYTSVFSVDDEEEHLKPKRMRLMSWDVPLSSSPPPADAWFQSKDTDKIMHPDFKNDCSSLDDEVAFLMCPSDVPLPVRPPPIAELRLCRKRTYSSVFPVNDEEEHLKPKRMRLMISDVSTVSKSSTCFPVCFPCPEDKRSDLMPLS